MKKYNLDVFKLSIIIILIGFLFCFYQFSQNGRFVKTDSIKISLDSRTGKLKDAIPIKEK